jgi:hypothetical protein
MDTDDGVDLERDETHWTIYFPRPYGKARGVAVLTDADMAFIVRKYREITGES